MVHFMARAFSLIIVPIVVYLAIFAVHFKVLYRTGPHDSFVSPGFQATLEGNRLNAPSESMLSVYPFSTVSSLSWNPPAVYYGSNITLLHHKLTNYLHSHPSNYPLRYDDNRVSSQGQQITGYPHIDDNNIWTLLPVDGVFTESVEDKTQPRYWKGGDHFYLEHFMTKKRLLTHDVASPLTPTNQEVTCVNIGERVNETVFVLDIVGTDAHVNTIDTKFRIKHLMTGVALFMHKGKYGEWGFGQLEVNGNKNSKDKGTSWVVDQHRGENGKMVG